MSRVTQTITVSTLQEVPTIHTLEALPRDVKLQLVFTGRQKLNRQAIGNQLKARLNNFQVGIHLIEPTISIAKLITDGEIEAHQDFFETCAKDYRKLGGELIANLVTELSLQLDENFPLKTFHELMANDRQTGQIGQWKYSIHGFHCCFQNEQTEQCIEVSLVFGMEFGDLDPYFFTDFIKSTPTYKPLPVAIYEDYADGAKIIEMMLALGKFERVNSNVGGHTGVVVTDREKVVIKSYEELEILYKIIRPGGSKGT